MAESQKFRPTANIFMKPKHLDLLFDFISPQCRVLLIGVRPMGRPLVQSAVGLSADLSTRPENANFY
jgi:hypothetical protein